MGETFKWKEIERGKEREGEGENTWNPRRMNMKVQRPERDGSQRTRER